MAGIPRRKNMMKKILLILAAAVAAFLPAEARAGTCDSAYSDSLPQMSGSIGALPPNLPNQVAPGKITKIFATGDGIDVTYTPTSGSPTTSHIGFGGTGRGVSCTHRQPSGWEPPNANLTTLAFHSAGFYTTVVINGSTQPMNVFDCWGIELDGDVNNPQGVSQITTGPDPQTISFSGWRLQDNGIHTRTLRAAGSCQLGPDSHVQYTRNTELTGGDSKYQLYSYGSGGITQVEFFVDGVSVGVDTTGYFDDGQYEYRLDVSPAWPPGFHKLKAVATFPVGQSVTERNVFFWRREVAAGANFSCSLGDESGQIRCWGANNYGQTGRGNTTSPATAPAVVLEGDHSPHYSDNLVWATDVAAGYEGACAVAVGDTNGDGYATGGVFCWGKNTNGLLGVDPAVLSYSSTPRTIFPVDSGATRVVVGGKHACATFLSGGTKCWGNGSYGQLGNGSTTASVWSPVTLTRGGSPIPVVQVQVARYTTYLLTNLGEVISFGRDDYGQLGDNATLANWATPRTVWASGATDLWAGWYHACLKTSSLVKCWGSNDHGEIGKGTFGGNQPTPATATQWTASTISSMALGNSVSCAVKTDGSAQCLGYNGNGDLGQGYVSTRSLTPVTPSGYTAVQSMSVGDNHVCAFYTGSMQCHGDNTYGQDGPSASNPQLIPIFASF